MTLDAASRSADGRIVEADSPARATIVEIGIEIDALAIANRSSTLIAATADTTTALIAAVILAAALALLALLARFLASRSSRPEWMSPAVIAAPASPSREAATAERAVSQGADESGELGALHRVAFAGSTTIVPVPPDTGFLGLAGTGVRMRSYTRCCPRWLATTADRQQTRSGPACRSRVHSSRY